MRVIQTFKVVIVGEGGVGKTTFVKRHLDGHFEQKYVATLGVEVHPLVFYTNYGEIHLMCWDTAGQEKFGGLRDGYYIQADGAILMFDLTSRLTVKNLPRWGHSVTKTAGNIPIVVVGTKSELARKVSDKDLESCSFKIQDTHLVSSRTGENIDSPFLELIRKLTGYNDLVFEN